MKISTLKSIFLPCMCPPFAANYEVTTDKGFETLEWERNCGKSSFFREKKRPLFQQHLSFMTHYHVKLRDLGSLIMGNFFMSMALIDKTRKKCSTSARWWGGPSGWGITLCWATLFCHKCELQTDKISSSKVVWWIRDYIKTKLFMGAFSLHQRQPKKESSAVL